MQPAIDISKYQGAWEDRGEAIDMIKMSGGDDVLKCIRGTGPAHPKSGYLNKWKDGKMHYQHRMAYESVHGPIPKGMHIHHTCDNKTCINVDHLVPLLPKKHFALHSIPKATQYYSDLEKCTKGHLLSSNDGVHKRCKTCRYERNLRWKSNPGVKERNNAVKQAWRKKRKEQGLSYA